MTFKCDGCGGQNTHYRMFSGGREYYCPDCDYEGSYPPPEEMNPAERPRAMLLQTEEGRVALTAQMDQELARRRAPHETDVPECICGHAKHNHIEGNGLCLVGSCAQPNCFRYQPRGICD